jgi:TIR domain
MSGSIFISYGHADMQPENWVDRLRLYLAQNLHQGGLTVWDDTKIAPGAEWKIQIIEALHRCDAAILLVGPAFLASDFVMAEELPKLLNAARNHEIPIFPLVVGYSAYKTSVLGAYQAFNNPEEPLESLPRHQQNRILNELAVVLGQKILRKTRPALPEQPRLTDAQSALKDIRRHLALTSRAFMAQAQQRDDLVLAITRRLRIRSNLEYEKFFFRYYPDLTREERFEFDRIRAITEGALKTSNEAIFDLIEKHPELMGYIPSLVALHQHLVFWLNKFQRVFTQHPEMCLLYTGVEDAVPFPEGVENDIDRWLTNQPAN